MYQRTMTGEPNEGTAKLPDLNAARDLGRRAAAGHHHRARLLSRRSLLDVINPAVERTMIQVGQHRPDTGRPAWKGRPPSERRDPSTADLAAAFQTPSIEYRSLLPMLIVFGVAVVGVLVEAFMGRAGRHSVQLGARRSAG